MNGGNPMNQLIEYTIALTNLYGLVHKDKVKEIYNSQNDNQVSSRDMEKLLINPPRELGNAFIYPHKDCFVHEAVLENEEFERLLRKKGNKPYYIPKKNELLKYVNGNYFEETKAQKNLLKYVKKNFFKGEEEKAEWLCEDIQDLNMLGLPMQSIFDTFNEFNINFKDIDQANEVIQLVTELSNNTRIWENNGYTPHEIFETYEKPNLKPLPEKAIEIKKEKVGRNDPCPCGSGKKYKKCCLKNKKISTK
jgi:hypothetical protein